MHVSKKQSEYSSCVLDFNEIQVIMVILPLNLRFVSMASTHKNIEMHTSIYVILGNSLDSPVVYEK